MCAFGPNLFGHGDAAIDAAYAEQMRRGDCLVGPGEPMLERGVYTHPWHNMVLCAATTPADIDKTIAAAGESSAELRIAAADLQPVPQLAAVFGQPSTGTD